MMLSVSRYIYGFDDNEFYGTFYHKLLGKNMLVLIKESDNIPSVFYLKTSLKIDVSSYMSDCCIISTDGSINFYVDILYDNMQLVKCF